MKHRRWMVRPAAALIAGIAALTTLQNPAHAQFDVEHHRAMVDIAATPPQPDEQGADEEPPGPDRPPPRPSKPGYMASAYHVDTASIWTSVGHKTPDSAKKRALDGCNAATGGGCYIVVAIKGVGRVSVAEDAMGRLWIMGAVYDEMLSPNDPAVELCRRSSFGCKFLGFHDSENIYLDEDPGLDQSRDRFPKGQLHWKRWALVARPPGQGKSWLISGREHSAAARKEILDRCRAESGTTCTISAFATHDTEMVARGTNVANGLLVHYVDAKGRNLWTSAVAGSGGRPGRSRGARNTPDPVTPEERVGRLCEPAPSCRIVGTYDAATPRLVVIADAP